MILAGVDYSINSPAMAVLDVDGEMSKCFPINEVVVCVVNKRIKKQDIINNRTVVIPYIMFKNNIERFDKLSNIFLSFLDPICDKDEKYVAIENYSYGSRGRAILQIAENVGLLKQKLYLKGCNIRLYEPTYIKKFATDDGRANKEKMGIELLSRFNYELDINVGLENNPTSDIVDAIWILYLLWSELKVRRGLEEGLLDRERLFIKTKTNKKEAILNQDFIKM